MCLAGVKYLGQEDHDGELGDHDGEEARNKSDEGEVDGLGNLGGFELGDVLAGAVVGCYAAEADVYEAKELTGFSSETAISLKFGSWEGGGETGA